MTRIEQMTMDAIQSMNRKMRDQHDIDWEQRRYEIAKEVMPWCCRSFRDFLLSCADFDADGKSFAEHVSAQAVGLADALIDGLRGVALGTQHTERNTERNMNGPA